MLSGGGTNAKAMRCGRSRQNLEDINTKGDIETGGACMRAQMTRRTRNNLTPSEMQPRGITQQNKGLCRRVPGAVGKAGAHIWKCLKPSTRPSLIFDGTAHTGR
jgi:hypothetical protein